MKALRKPDEDTSMPGEEQMVNFKDFLLKDRVSGISKSWRHKLKKWAIVISVNGVANDIHMWFKSQATCDEVVEYMTDWLNLK